jgi:hypothetical protein
MIDLIMTSTTCVMSYAMVPQVIKSFRDRNVCLAWQTMILTTVCILVLTLCFWHLGLVLNTIANAFLTLLWCSLMVMKVFFKKDLTNEPT